jgi:hypothetical protein
MPPPGNETLVQLDPPSVDRQAAGNALSPA